MLYVEKVVTKFIHVDINAISSVINNAIKMNVNKRLKKYLIVVIKIKIVYVEKI